MTPIDPLPSGLPSAAPANQIGERVLNALEAFVKQNEDNKRDMDDVKKSVGRIDEGLVKIREDVTNLKIENAADRSALIGLKESIERNNSKLDSLEEKITSRLHELDGKASDMKANITSLGVKTNTNLLIHASQFIALIIGVFSITANLNNQSRNLNNTAPTAGPYAAPPASKLQIQP
ncbi:MAG: hypothetical protein ACO3B3_02650 [Cyanobium sp.]